MAFCPSLAMMFRRSCKAWMRYLKFQWGMAKPPLCHYQQARSDLGMTKAVY